MHHAPCVSLAGCPRPGGHWAVKKISDITRKDQSIRVIVKITEKVTQITLEGSPKVLIRPVCRLIFYFSVILYNVSTFVLSYHGSK